MHKRKNRIILGSSLAGMLIATPLLTMGTAFAEEEETVSTEETSYTFVTSENLTADQTVTITGIPTENQSAHTFKLYRLGTYSFANVNGTDLDSFDVKTDAKYTELIKTALGTNASSADATNPLQYVLENITSANDSSTGYSGGLRDFVDALIAGGLADLDPEETITTTAGSDTATGTDIGAGIYIAIDSSTTDTGGIPAFFGTSVGGATTLNNEALSTFVFKKNTPETPTKVVLDDDNSNAEVDSASIGGNETVTFKLTQKIPYTTSFDSYTLKLIDELPAGLDYVETTSVTVNGTDYTDYTLDENAGTGKKGLTYTFAKVKDMTAGQDIVVTYTAKLNANAVVNGDGQKNSLHTDYNNNPNDTSVFASTPTDDVTLKTHQFELKKTTMNGGDLTGASFTIKPVVNDTAGDPLQFDTNGKLVASGGSTTVTVGDSVLSNLEAGTYEIEETAAPAHYSSNFLPTVRITIGEDGSVTEGTGDTNKLVDVDNGVVTVKNAKSIMEMPATGAVGVARSLGFALLAFGAGGGLIMGARHSKKEKK